MLFDLPLQNLGIATTSLLGLVACAMFVVKGIFVALSLFAEYLR